jgi:hypothetical protein
VRYEAIVFGLAFVAGLGGAMSQQGVAPPVNVVHADWTQQAAVIPLQPAPVASDTTSAAVPEVAEAAPVPATTKPVHHHAKKVAAKPPQKPVTVAEEHHSFWYRLFHKSSGDEVAAAEPQH